MSLFNYGECDMCKLHQNSKKEVMMDVLPVDICCKISEYFGCWKCERMKENEKHFFQGFTGVNDDVNKTSNQLKCFTMFKMPSLSTHQACNDRSDKYFKKEIDRIFDKQSVKNKYVFKKMDLQAIKSYCKKNSAIIKLLVWGCHSKEELYKTFSPFFLNSDNNIYIFRNREYVIRDLLKWFLIEYIDDLIGDDKVYCDMDKIREHINKLFRN